MKLAHFIGVILAAVLAALIGTGLLSTQQGEQSFERKALIENFDFDSVYKVRIQGEGHSVELNKQLASWHVKQVHSYAADMTLLSELLQQLKAAEIQEYKTSNSKNYHRLGLTSAEQEDSSSIQITLVNNEQKVEVLLGNNAKSGPGQYAKLATSPQTFLLNDSFAVKTTPKAWLQQRILSYHFDNIRQLNWADNEGAKFSAARKEQAVTGKLEIDNGQPLLPNGEVKLKPDFELASPEGDYELMYESALSGLVRNTIQLELQTVVPKSEHKLSGLEAVYNIELIAELKGQKETTVLSFYQGEPEQYWLEVAGRDWIFQISEYSFKQLGKPIQDYLAE